MVDRLINAAEQSTGFCWPMFGLFVAVILAVFGAFIYFNFCDRTGNPGPEPARRKRTTRSASPSPCRPGIFDQDAQPSWSPSARECRLELRAHFRRRNRSRVS